MQNNQLNTINGALKELSEKQSISSAVAVCNALLAYMGVETKSIEDVELSKLRLPNAERYDRWFEAHPHFRGDRACFELTPDQPMIEAKFYALQRRSKLFIAGSVTFTPNFEDRDYTRSDPNMPVGIDFFLPPEKDSVIVVLSNKGTLRLVELSGRITNTQHEIFALWNNVALTADRNVLHTTIWESFKLSSLNKKFYEGIANSFTSLTQHLKTSGVEEQLANQFASRLHGRLLFLWFLRKKHIINEEKGYFTLGDQDDTKYYAKTLSTLFFNVLNNEDHKEADPVTPYLNGGLFDEETDGEYWKKHAPTFPTGFFKVLYEHFDSFNFTTDESTPEYEQIAIDPEMLGRIFESFLATLKTETGAQAKKANGAFYTPREIVSYMSKESLRQYLYTALEANEALKTSIDDLLDTPDNEWALAGTNSKRDKVAKEDRQYILDALNNIRVLDPAVGSGAFPMGILHKILSIYERLDPKFDPYDTKLNILRNNIYGVDIDPTAIEISRLRAWLSVIVDAEDMKKIKPLPNLDFKFVCANTLIGLTDSDASFTTDETLKPTLVRIRDEYYSTSSKTKKEKLQKEYTRLTRKPDLFDTEETKQLKSYQPFEIGSSASFYDPELMHGVRAFDVVIGNPPYVRISKIEKNLKLIYKDNFKTAYGSYDIYSLFFEKAFSLLSNYGNYCFITSNKFLIADYAKPLRDLMLNETHLIMLIDLADCKRVFASAFVSPAIVLGGKHKKIDKYDISVAVLKDDDVSRLDSVSFTKTTNPFSLHLIDNIVSTLMDKIELNTIELGKIADVRTGMMGFDYWSLEPFISDGYKKNSIRIVTNGFVDQYKYTWGQKGRLYKKDFREPYLDIENTNINKATKELFLKKKIIIRGVAQRLSANLDSEGFGLLVAVHSAIINDPKEYNVKYILALLNSSLMNWVHLKKFYSARIPEGSLKYPISFIKSIPIKKAGSELQKELAKLVDLIFSTEDEDQIIVIKNKIDNLAYKLYGLNDEEREIIEENK